MNKINTEFDKIVCINLVNRPDKKEQARLRFNALGIEVEWFTAVEYGFAKQIVDALPSSYPGFARFNAKQPNEFGAAMSHYSVIKAAYEQGIERLFVFEDDIKFINDFNKHFDNYFNKLPKDWDMINLYSFMYDYKPENVRVNSRWVKSFNSWSLMAYGMNRKAMAQYIHEQDINFRIADLASFDMQGKDLNIYSTVPTLCIPNQQLGSNIRGDNMNYVSTNTVLNLGFANENYN